MVDKLNITDGLSVFEVGCGCGAFLYAMQEICQIIPGGIDYSNSLISTAKRVMLEGSIDAYEAIKLNTNKKYDVLILNSVFQYLIQSMQRLCSKKCSKKQSRKKSNFYFGSTRPKVQRGI